MGYLGVDLLVDEFEDLVRGEGQISNFEFRFSNFREQSSNSKVQGRTLPAVVYLRREESGMLKTVEAEITPDGSVTLLEPVEVMRTSRALVTVMENGHAAREGNVATVLEFLRNNGLPAESRRSAEDIEAGILENRNSWD